MGQFSTAFNSLALDGSDLALTSDIRAERIRLSLAGDLTDGSAYSAAVPLTPQLRGQLQGFSAQALALEGHAPRTSASKRITRAALLHLRALQALDASQAGASHRDIAQAVFGLEAVVMRWHEDGELRAQVRHLLRRTHVFMQGGYLTLAGINHRTTTHTGDEPIH